MPTVRGREFTLLAGRLVYFFLPGFFPPFLPFAVSSSSPAAAFALFLPSGVLAYHVYNVGVNADSDL